MNKVLQMVRGSGLRLGTASTLGVAFGVCWAFAFPVIIHFSKMDDLKAKALSNIKQLDTATFIYTADSDDVFPIGPTTAKVFVEMYPYDKNHALEKTLNPKGGKILFNSHLFGVDMTSLAEPEKMPLVYDSKPWPDGTRPVGFADGHAKTITKQEWPEVQKYLNKWLRPIQHHRP